MKVTYNWLKDFVDITLSAQELADKLTMAGLEVTALDKHDGDSVFEIEVTSNRPDWLSVAGIAREVAAITGKQMKPFAAAKSALRPKSAKQPCLSIEDKKDCPFYTARIIEGAKIGPAPDWMRKRLELIGCRSINNVVDITNYCLFTLGEPLHAFDLDKMLRQVGGDSFKNLVVGVRRAKDGEGIITIDAQARKLNHQILLITAARGNGPDRPIAVAGIIGGKDTEVDEGTKNILLEAALFNPLVTRGARRALGVQTESSYRFERGIDMGAVRLASLYASVLIEKFAQARASVYVSAGAQEAKKRTVILDAERAQKILGVSLTTQQIKNTLARLSLFVKAKNKNRMEVTVPEFRGDVSQDVDLIEELARVTGYGNITPTLPAACVRQVEGKKDLLAITKNILTGLGLQEVITYALVERKSLEGFSREDPLEVLNPLSQDQEVLRTTLAPGLLSCVSRNLNQQEPYVAIFETAKRFAAQKEELTLGVALCGERQKLSSDGLIKDKASPLHLKGIVDTLLNRLGINDYALQLVAGNAVAIKVQGQDAGMIFNAPKNILDRHGIKNKEVFLMELSLERIFALSCPEKKFKSLPQYPAIQRDISMLIKESVTASDILSCARANAPALLAEVKVSDFYKGKQIPSGYKGLTISCIYRSSGRTLTEEEVVPLYASICAALQDKFAAKIR